MKILLTLLLGFLMPSGLLAQSHDLSSDEPKDPAAWETLGNSPMLTWASRDTHYAKAAVPRLNQKTDREVSAWKGERVSVLALVCTKNGIGQAVVSLTDSEGKPVDGQIATARFVNYVLCDEKKMCGDNPMTSPTYLVPDIIDDNGGPRNLAPMTTRPVWVTIEVPRDANAGEQTLRLVLKSRASGEDLGSLNLKLKILDRTLPQPADYAFHTDFWQQPYAVSRYYNVPRWSEKHFALLKPYLKLLARGGQKVVTTILFYEPWGAQSNDKFDAMIKTTKRKNGKWRYDYTIFDRYVQLCDSCGINAQINCYSMIPWDMSFRYYDEATGKDIDLKAKTSDEAYRELWVPFLKSFAQHLKKKGWYDKTCIAMDERGLEDMLRALKIVREAVPDMKVALAGNRHKELVKDVYDYSLHLGQTFTAGERAMRDSLGMVSTAYTACNHLTPNLETYNAPADAAYLPLYCIANGFNGFLHWAWMNWTDHPIQDSRFKFFPPGDTYCIYPGPRSSVRWERYIEGVQQAEKYRILKAAYTQDGNKEALDKLEKGLKTFQSGELYFEDTSARLVNAFEQLLNM